jgi:hypothetical protein
MTNEQVCNRFSERERGHSLNVTSTGRKLFSYKTVIAQWIDGKLVVNGTKYSPTTSKHSYYVRRYPHTVTSKCVPINTYDLRPYL